MGYREEQPRLLADAAYKRRGWTRNGVPTSDKVKTLGIDFPSVVKFVSKFEKTEPQRKTLPKSNSAWK